MEYAAGGTLYDLVNSKAKAGKLLDEDEVKETNVDETKTTCISWAGGPPVRPDRAGHAVRPPEPDLAQGPQVSEHLSHPLARSCQDRRLWHLQDPLQQEQGSDGGGHALLYLPGALRGKTLQCQVGEGAGPPPPEVGHHDVPDPQV